MLSANKRDVILLMKPCWFYDGSGWCCRGGLTLGFMGEGQVFLGREQILGRCNVFLVWGFGHCGRDS